VCRIEETPVGSFAKDTATSEYKSQGRLRMGDFPPFARLGLAVWYTKRLLFLGLVSRPPGSEGMQVPPTTGSYNSRSLDESGLWYSQVCSWRSVSIEESKIAMTSDHVPSRQCNQQLQL